MLNWDKVNELRQEIGDEDFAEVVELFLDEVNETIQVLRDGPPDEALEETLHFLKGSALNLGFETFSTLCAEGESAARTGQFHNIDLEKIISNYDESKAVFLAELPNRMAA